MKWVVGLLFLMFSFGGFVDCVDDAAAYHRVNPVILRAIIALESGGNPNTVRKNKNGSLDYGLTGINSVHLSKLSQYGIQDRDLMNPCINVYVSGWLYSKKIAKYGDTWQAVGAYHSETPTHRDIYIRSIMQKLGMIIHK